MELKNLYKQMFKIRLFEEKVLDLFSEGKINGTTHAYIGQEANAVGVISNLDSNDFLISNHRCHGHYIAFIDDPYKLFCEIMGKKDGMCGGIGGSQHIKDKNFFSNGVQGGIMPLAAGIAFSIKSKRNQLVTVFIGDGTLGQGVVYECLNIISMWKLPILIVLENNQYAQSTHISKTLSGNIKKRFEAFDIRTTEISSFDVIKINKKSKKIISEIKLDGKAQCLIINTYRFASHSKSDDGRDKNEIEKWKLKDPLLVAQNSMEKNSIKEINTRIRQEIDKSCNNALISVDAV